MQIDLSAAVIDESADHCSESPYTPTKQARHDKIFP
jgi:hypothetical protein